MNRAGFSNGESRTRQTRFTPCPSKIYGVDFSGAKNAGTKIWVTNAVTVGNTLGIEDCYQARDLPHSASERDRCLGALRSFIAVQKSCAVGLDFPFSLPRTLVKANSWQGFVLTFASRYPDPEQFREDCRRSAVGPESQSKRETDIEAKTPWCAYNLRIYKQTYYGIRDVLAPLVRGGLAYVLPMQRDATPDKPWLLEVCPASTLQKRCLYLLPYKRSDKESMMRRTRILDGLQQTSAISIESSTLRSKILNDSHGDALDSVIAALATFCALGNPARLFDPGASAYRLEGHVYV